MIAIRRMNTRMGSPTRTGLVNVQMVDGLAIEADDYVGDARSLNWIAGDGKSRVRLAAAHPEAISIAEPIAQPALVAELIPHSHDPLSRFALKSRAPPA